MHEVVLGVRAYPLLQDKGTDQSILRVRRECISGGERKRYFNRFTLKNREDLSGKSFAPDFDRVSSTSSRLRLRGCWVCERRPSRIRRVHCTQRHGFCEDGGFTDSRGRGYRRRAREVARIPAGRKQVEETRQDETRTDDLPVTRYQYHLCQ